MDQETYSSFPRTAQAPYPVDYRRDHSLCRTGGQQLQEVRIPVTRATGRASSDTGENMLYSRVAVRGKMVWQIRSPTASNHKALYARAGANVGICFITNVDTDIVINA